MNYIVLVAPFIITGLFLLSFVLILLKRYWFGGILFLFTVIFNIYIECIPFNLSFGKDRGDLKILTYNMYSASDYYHSVEDNPKDVRDFLLAQDADIIVLEEYYPDKCIALRDSLLKVYPYLEYQKFHCSNAIYSKYPLSPIEEMTLDLENNVLDEYKMKKAEEYDHLRKMYLYRDITSMWVKIGNDSIRLIACHMASNHFDAVREVMTDSIGKKDKITKFLKCLKAGRIEREVEARNIMRDVVTLNAAKQKIVVLGDMNDVAGSTTLMALQENGILKNAWWKKGFGWGLTFHNHKVMHFRLDHVLFNKHIKLKNIEIVEQSFSDHHALAVNFDL